MSQYIYLQLKEILTIYQHVGVFPHLKCIIFTKSSQFLIRDKTWCVEMAHSSSTILSQGTEKFLQFWLFIL